MVGGFLATPVWASNLFDLSLHLCYVINVFSVTLMKVMEAILIESLVLFNNYFADSLHLTCDLRKFL